MLSVANKLVGRRGVTKKVFVTGVWHIHVRCDKQTCLSQRCVKHFMFVTEVYENVCVPRTCESETVCVSRKCDKQVHEGTNTHVCHRGVTKKSVCHRGVNACTCHRGVTKTSVCHRGVTNRSVLMVTVMTMIMTTMMMICDTYWVYEQ